MNLVNCWIRNLRGWNIETKLKVHIDVSAAFGTCKRQGFGKSRRAQTRVFWIQERLANNEVALEKVGANQDIADVCTKSLAVEGVRNT